MPYGNPSCLYVIEMADGVVKAGITSRGEQRLIEHARSGRVLREFRTGFVSGFDAENDLLRRMARIGAVIRGREWFSGVPFSVAKQLAAQVARKFTNPNPVSMNHKLRKQFAALRFTDHEIKVLDAYCARFGMSRRTEAHAAAPARVRRAAKRH